jgi:prefoldin subunit 2
LSFHIKRRELASNGLDLILTAELQGQYDRFKSTLSQLSQKIGELESEADEHKLVLETLTPLDKGRKCFRMVGGVLVEKTVGEVIPLLETTKSGLEKALETLASDYKKTEKDLHEWQKANKVQIVQT